MEHTINLTTETPYATVTILEGKAPDPINPTRAHLSGNIYAVYDYIKVKEQYKGDIKNSALIVFDYTGTRILLDDNPNSPVSTLIEAKFEVHPKITEFGINTDKRFSSEDLKRIIKLHPHLFVSKDSHSAFLRQLGNFKAKIERDIENSKDNRGTSKNQNNTMVNNLEIEETFKMKCPLFKGCPAAEFEVVVCYEVSGSGISFYFESSDLIVQSQNYIDDVFATQREYFTDQKYVTIAK